MVRSVVSPPKTRVAVPHGSPFFVFVFPVPFFQLTTIITVFLTGRDMMEHVFEVLSFSFFFFLVVLFHFLPGCSS